MENIYELKNGVVVKENDVGFEIISKNGNIMRLDDEGEFIYYEKNSNSTDKEKEVFLKHFSQIMKNV